MGGGNFKNIIDIFLPVGIIIEFNKEMDPNNLYPGTIWERIKGKCLVGLDEDDDDFNQLGQTGGEKRHKLIKEELPYHDHGFIEGSHSFTWGDGNCTVYASNAIAIAGGAPSNNLCTKQHVYNKTDNNATTESAHNNLQPYQVVYIWQRVA